MQCFFATIEKRGFGAVAGGAMAAMLACMAPAQAETSIGRQAREWKVTQCLRSIEALGDFLTKDTKFSVRSDSGPTDPGQEIYSVSLVAQPQKGNAPAGQPYFAHAVVAPLPGGGCNASYDVVTHYPQTCEAVQRTVLKDFSKRQDFGTNAMAYATADNRTVAYMMPSSGPGSAKGCTVIKQQTLYRADLPH